MNELPFEAVPGLAVRLYRMCWQLETWLRLILYVEFRAEYLNWEDRIHELLRGTWPPRSLFKDKELHHMATPHEEGISYLTFGQLWTVISHTEHWKLFESYFPPKANTQERISEVMAIRNRVAHFREPHIRDIDRLKLFLHDMNPGIRRFCIRYSSEAFHLDNPIASMLDSVWEDLGLGIELQHSKGWLYASGGYRFQPAMNAELELLARPTSSEGSHPGVIYLLKLYSRKNDFDSALFIERTRNLHKDLIHIFLTPLSSEIRVTVPGNHEIVHTYNIIVKILSAARAASSRSQLPAKPDLSELPELVLRPYHILAYFTEECREPILEVEEPKPPRPRKRRVRK